MHKSIPIWVRSVAAALLFAMVYYFAGYRVVYFFLMHDAKSEAAMVMKNEKGVMQSLTLTDKEYSKLKWSEAGKEFSFKGELYDVISVTKDKAGYVLHVYADKNETHWANALHDFEKQFFPGSNDCDKSMKCAEGLASAFQKEYTPLNVLNIRQPEIKQVVYYTQNSATPVAAVFADIWHPPTC